MNPWLEKILYALIPLVLSGIVFLFSTVLDLQEDVKLVKDEAALARLQLKVDLNEEVQKNQERIAVLEEQVKELQKKN